MQGTRHGRWRVARQGAARATRGTWSADAPPPPRPAATCTPSTAETCAPAASWCVPARPAAHPALHTTCHTMEPILAAYLSTRVARMHHVLMVENDCVRRIWLGAVKFAQLRKCWIGRSLAPYAYCCFEKPQQMGLDPRDLNHSRVLQNSRVVMRCPSNAGVCSFKVQCID